MAKRARDVSSAESRLSIADDSKCGAGEGYIVVAEINATANVKETDSDVALGSGEEG